MNAGLALLVLALPSLPFLLIYLSGAILCITRRRFHPRLSLLGFPAFLLFAVRLGGGVVQTWLSVHYKDFGWDFDTLALYKAMVALGDMGLGIAAWGLLLAAIFSGRGSLPRRDPEEGSDTSF